MARPVAARTLLVVVLGLIGAGCGGHATDTTKQRSRAPLVAVIKGLDNPFSPRCGTDSSRRPRGITQRFTSPPT